MQFTVQLSFVFAADHGHTFRQRMSGLVAVPSDGLPFLPPPFGVFDEAEKPSCYSMAGMHSRSVHDIGRQCRRPSTGTCRMPSLPSWRTRAIEWPVHLENWRAGIDDRGTAPSDPRRD
jgi:hypothetical protein